MNFKLALLALSSVFGHADAAALRNSNVLVITSDESESTGDTPKPAKDPHSFLSENGSSTSNTACDYKCKGSVACYGMDGKMIGCGDKCAGFGACYGGVDQSKVGCGSCGSCDSSLACFGYAGDSIGDNSCTETNSCAEATAIVGNNSCNAKDACLKATGYIGNNQCNSVKECENKHFPALSLYKLTPYNDDCRDSEGRLYGMIEGPTKVSPAECAQFCRQPSLTNGFQVGMQLNHDGKYANCLCLYDGNGKLPPSPGGDITRIFESAPAARKGYGPVAKGNSDFIECYPLKNVNNVHHSSNEHTPTTDY